MSNPWSAPVIKPLSKLVAFFRIQIAGAPAERVAEAIASIEEHVSEEIRAAVEPLRDEITSLRGEAPAVAAEAPDLFAEIREEIAAIRQENAAIRQENADLRAAFEKHASATAAAVQKRLAEVEPGKSGAAPSRTPVPPRSAATAS